MMERLYLYNLYKSAFIVKLLTKPDLYHICGCVANGHMAFVENVASEIMACMQKKKRFLTVEPWLLISKSVSILLENFLISL